MALPKEAIVLHILCRVALIYFNPFVLDLELANETVSHLGQYLRVMRISNTTNVIHMCNVH